MPTPADLRLRAAELRREAKAALKAALRSADLLEREADAAERQLQSALDSLPLHSRADSATLNAMSASANPVAASKPGRPLNPKSGPVAAVAHALGIGNIREMARLMGVNPITLLSANRPDRGGPSADLAAKIKAFADSYQAKKKDTPKK